MHEPVGSVSIRPLIKGPARNLDDRLDDLQDYLAEQLNIIMAIAASQALTAEQQTLIFEAQTNTDTLVRRVNLNVITVVKTTDSILGITSRTETMVRAIRQRDAWSLINLAFDPWLCLYMYIGLHPFASVFIERVTSVWQFVLLQYRLINLLKDACAMTAVTSVGAIFHLYFTSPYKAIYYLYWLNRAFVYRDIVAIHGNTVSIQFPELTCSMPITTDSLMCLADYTVDSLGHVVKGFRGVVTNSEVWLQLSVLKDLEWMIWATVLSYIYSQIAQLFYNALPSRIRFFF